MGSSIVHLCINIDGMLRRGIKKGLVTDDAGRELSGHEGRRWVLEQKAKGYRVLPFGDPCEGFDYQTGCPGHPRQELPGDPFDRAPRPAEAPTRLEGPHG